MGNPTFLFHPEHGANIFDSDLVPALEKQGWKDTPAGMDIKPYNKAGCYTKKLRRAAGKTVEEQLKTVPVQPPEVTALLNKGEFNISSWMRAKGLNPKNAELRKETKKEYEAILERLEGKIVKNLHSWRWENGDNNGKNPYKISP